MRHAKPLSLWLDYLPTGKLTENARRRMHWAEYSRVHGQERSDAKKALLEALGRSRPRFECFSVAYQFHFGDKKLRDRDGLVQRIKVVQDMMVEVGLIPDDSDRYMEGFEMRKPVYGASKEGLAIWIGRWQEGGDQA